MVSSSRPDLHYPRDWRRPYERPGREIVERTGEALDVERVGLSGPCGIPDVGRPFPEETVGPDGTEKGDLPFAPLSLLFRLELVSCFQPSTKILSEHLL